MVDLELRDLSVAHDGHLVLDRCSGAFLGGRRTVLWGASGTGKSTLLAAIAGLLEPSGGEIALGEGLLFSRAQKINLAPHRRHIGFVFQDLALWPHLTALKQVRLAGAAVRLDREGALDLLAAVGLRALAGRRPGQLSGGEQQRLAIARALAGKPQVLLLDEPFSSVDVETKASLIDLLRRLSPQVAGPTIYVTHDPGDARELAEAAFRLHQGALKAVPDTAALGLA